MWQSACWVFSSMWFNQTFGPSMELFSDLLIYRHVVLCSFSGHKLFSSLKSFYCSNEMLICILGHSHWFRKQWSHRHGGRYLLILTVSHTPSFEENVAGVVSAMVGIARSIFTAGTYFHLDEWNTNFSCWEGLSEAGKAVRVYFQVSSIYS